MTIQALLIVCPLAMLAGFVDSVAGGGGLISLPAYFMAGLRPALAAGTNKLSACLGTMASVWRYHKSGRIRYAGALPAALAALPGSYLGTMLLLHINPDFLKWMVIIALPFVAAMVLIKKPGESRKRAVSAKWIPLVSSIIGLTVGFYDGMIGPGTGTFLILLFTTFAGMEVVEASASAKVVNLASNLASLITLLVNQSVLIPLGLAAAVFSIGGNLLGATYTVKRGAGFVRVILLCVLTLLLAKLVLDMVT